LRCCSRQPESVLAWPLRILGVREIAQAGLLERQGLRRTGALVESAHAASLVWAGARWPEQRRCALMGAGVSVLLVAAELGS
jgi:hypothetical protein